MPELIGILIILFLVAFLYSSVGHGGASGYIATLSIIGISTSIIRPTALILNVFVAGISFYYYYKNHFFRWKLFFPFAILSIPAAYLGSFIILDPLWYKRLLGLCLIIAVLRIVGIFNTKKEIKSINFFIGILIGGLIGFLSGMIGIGGGIILSPIILLYHWGNLKETSAVSALFIVVNSLAGIVGLYNQSIIWHPHLFLWILVSITGGLLGSYWGSKKAGNIALKNVLAIVLFFAALKLIFI